MRIIAGPCQHESLEQSLEIARECKRVCDQLDIDYIFKASFDKANRTSMKGQRGKGLDVTLEAFRTMKLEIAGLQTLTDVHDTKQVYVIKENYNDAVDILQIPAFLCRQTDLIKEACQSGKPLNIKKGQFLSPDQMKNIIEKCSNFGNDQIMLCERGTSFGYDNLVVDMLGMSKLKTFNCPIIFDVTHSLQLPGQGKTAAGGRGDQAEDLAKAGVSLGIAGLFIEVHPDPKEALCDGPSATPLDQFETLLTKVNAVDQAVKGF